MLPEARFSICSRVKCAKRTSEHYDAEHGMKSGLRNGSLGDVRDAFAQLVRRYLVFGSSCVM